MSPSLKSSQMAFGSHGIKERGNSHSNKPAKGVDLNKSLMTRRDMFRKVPYN